MTIIKQIKSWRSNIQYSEYRQKYCIIIIKFAKKLRDLICSHHIKEIIIQHRMLNIERVQLS